MTIGDKCPYCGRELFSGYLQSARQIIWSQEEKSMSFRADEEGDLEGETPSGTNSVGGDLGRPPSSKVIPLGRADQGQPLRGNKASRPPP